MEVILLKVKNIKLEDRKIRGVKKKVVVFTKLVTIDSIGKEKTIRIIRESRWVVVVWK